MNALTPTPASPPASDDDRARAAPTTVQTPAVERPLGGTRRPVRALLTYYIMQAVATGPGFLVMMPLRFFRYHTLRYFFDDEGVTVRWGILFRREISLTYARIQDIHLVSNIIERWLGLGRVQVQTASGQAGAEMTIEGLPDYELIRDELYRRMRGARGGRTDAATASHEVAVHRHAPTPGTLSSDGNGTALADATAALNDAVAELRAIRGLLERERR